jgi:hypothetical protein
MKKLTPKSTTKPKVQGSSKTVAVKSRGIVASGRGTLAPGRAGVTPGRASVTPGRAGVTPGRAGVTPGHDRKRRSVATPGRTKLATGRSGRHAGTYEARVRSEHACCGPQGDAGIVDRTDIRDTHREQHARRGIRIRVPRSVVWRLLRLRRRSGIA